MTGDLALAWISIVFMYLTFWVNFFRKVILGPMGFAHKQISSFTVISKWFSET